jgi:aryl-alcohol dehydrogenase-like predicted oxidoreductase
MMYDRFHQGETLSEIGMGCYAVSGAYGARDPEAFVSLLGQAYERGVTFFDTAAIYGPAEEILGRAVAPFRHRVWIATKVGTREDGQRDCSAEQVVASCEQSLRRLGTDYIDLYQVHFDDPDTPVEETVGALEQLKAAGKIRYYGIGHLPTARMEGYFSTGQVFSALVELSAVARGARERIVPLCRQHGVAVIAFSTTGRGLLTGQMGPETAFEEGDIRRVDPLFQRERLASGLRIAQKLGALGDKVGKTPAQVAIAWVLAQPGVVCALTGPSTLAHLEENLGGSGWTIDQADLAALGLFFAQEDVRLHREQMASLRAILGQPLHPAKAFADLVYLLETLVETGFATEHEILAIFHQLWSLEGRHDAAALKQMQAIQAALREQFAVRLETEAAPSQRR